MYNKNRTSYNMDIKHIVKISATINKHLSFNLFTATLIILS